MIRPYSIPEGLLNRTKQNAREARVTPAEFTRNGIHFLGRLLRIHIDISSEEGRIQISPGLPPSQWSTPNWVDIPYRPFQGSEPTDEGRMVSTAIDLSLAQKDFRTVESAYAQRLHGPEESSIQGHIIREAARLRNSIYETVQTYPFYVLYTASSEQAAFGAAEEWFRFQ